jgi:prepilin-type N-terminal cleavage/methylation domain-containing protein/prepilin-type processing-associated H-X9-DG protein
MARQASSTGRDRAGVRARCSVFRLQPARAFTLLELLVVIAIIGLLAAFLLPTLSRSRDQAIRTYCSNNLKQLQVCWHMYVGDNEDVMPPNNFVYFVEVGVTNSEKLGEDGMTWCRGLAPMDTNEIDETTSLLFRYNRHPGIYRCPADHSTIEGYPDMPRKRSYNVSNSANCARDNHFRRSTEIKAPADLFVFIDTNEDTIWDSTFGTLPMGCQWEDYWLDVPADRHSLGCNVTFADGHVEFWRWRAPKTGLWVGEHSWCDEDLLDLRQMQEHIKGAGGN